MLRLRRHSRSGVNVAASSATMMLKICGSLVLLVGVSCVFSGTAQVENITTDSMMGVDNLNRFSSYLAKTEEACGLFEPDTLPMPSRDRILYYLLYLFSKIIKDFLLE